MTDIGQPRGGDMLIDVARAHACEFEGPSVSD